MADLKAFAEQLVNLTVKEVNELAQILKDEYGIEPAAAAVAVAAGPAAGAAAAEEEKTEFDVILSEGTHWSRTEGSQGIGGRRSEGCQRRYLQRRSRRSQEGFGRSRRSDRIEIIRFTSDNQVQASRSSGGLYLLYFLCA